MDSSFRAPAMEPSTLTGRTWPTHRNRVMRRRCPACSITEMTGSQAVRMRAGLLNCQAFSQSPKGFTLRERV